MTLAFTRQFYDSSTSIQFGSFRCIAFNDAGQSVTSCTISIEGSRRPRDCQKYLSNLAESDILKELKLRELRRAIKLEKAPLREIYDIQEVEVEEYSLAESVQ